MGTKKKYVSLSKLSTFLDNLKNVFALKNHVHPTSDISDFVIDSELSSTSTNPVQNKVIDAEFEAVSQAMNALDLAIDSKADASHPHAISEVTDLQVALDGKSDIAHTHPYGDLQNKPFWEESINPYFDGDITGRETIQMDTDTYLVKMTDSVISKEDCIGAELIFEVNGEKQTFQITENCVQDMTAQLGIPLFMVMPSEEMPISAVCIVKEAGTVEGISFTKGTYYVLGDTDEEHIHTYYFSALSGTVVHKLDPKYLHDSVPCIVQEGYKNVILPECTPEYNTYDGWFQLPIEPVLINGVNYKVTYNGVDYQCIAYADSAGLFGDSISIGDLTTTPFKVQYVPGMSWTVLIASDPNDPNACQSVSIEEYQEEIIRRLDNKLLPEHLPCEEGGKVIVEEFSFVTSHSSPYQIYEAFPITEEGKTFVVTYNGKDYSSSVKSGWTDSLEQWFLLGNTKAIGGEDTGEPFAIYVFDNIVKSTAILDTTTSEQVSCTIKIAEPGTIRKLDMKYLPDHLPFAKTVAKALLNPTSATKTTNETYGEVWLIEGVTTILEIGKAYTVNYNGTDYTSIAKAAPEGMTNDTSAACLGNLAPVGQEDTGEPFALIIAPEYGELTCMDLSGSEAVTIGISCEKEIVHKLDNKFLDLDWVPKKEPAQTEPLLAEVTVTYDETITEPYAAVNGVSLTAGETYDIYFDGAKYTCMAKEAVPNDGGELVYVGNGSFLTNNDGSIPASSEPFLIYQGDPSLGNFIVLAKADKEPVTLRIDKVKAGEVNKLPVEYLPDGYPYSEGGGAAVTDTLTFDGNIEGKEAVEFDAGAYVVKISDTFVESTELLGGTYNIVSSVEDIPSGSYPITEDEIFDTSDQYGFPSYGISDFIICISQDFTMDGITLTKGIHIMCIPGVFYVTELKAPSAIFGTAEIIHKLDNKFLDLDWIPKKEFTVSGEILPETKVVTEETQDSNGNTIYGASIDNDLNIDTLYNYGRLFVVYDGVVYECEAEGETGIDHNVWYGNFSKIPLGPSEVDNGMPFVLGKVVSSTMAFVADTPGEHTFAIYENCEVHNKLPVEFLPEINPFGESVVLVHLDMNTGKLSHTPAELMELQQQGKTFIAAEQPGATMAVTESSVIVFAPSIMPDGDQFTLIYGSITFDETGTASGSKIYTVPLTEVQM